MKGKSSGDPCTVGESATYSDIGITPIWSEGALREPHCAGRCDSFVVETDVHYPTDVKPVVGRDALPAAGDGAVGRAARGLWLAPVASSLGRGAPLVRVEVGALVDRLAAHGFGVEDSRLTVKEFAEGVGADPDDMLFVVLRREGD